MRLGKTWIVVLGIMSVCIWAAISDTFVFPKLLAFPFLSLVVVLVGTLYSRSRSVESFFVYTPLKLYSFIRIPVKLLNMEPYLTDVSCYVENDSLKTQISYLGINSEFQSDLDSIVDEYLELVDEDGELVLYKDTNLKSFKSSIESSNCSTCYHSSELNTSVDVAWGYNTSISWTLSLCGNCWERVLREQLRTMSEETEFESKMVIEKL